jgi:SEC-C motif-containing protein
MSLCPCGSTLAYDSCCQPYIEGKTKAPTAEALMRSRYSAFTVHAVDYIVKTVTKRDPANLDPEAIKTWSTTSEWLGLKIIKTVSGGPSDTEGEVEFVASFSQKGNKQEIHEYAYFKKIGDQWLYDTCKKNVNTVVRDSPKIGRNDPCTCGSGKKFKQCCAKI